MQFQLLGIVSLLLCLGYSACTVSQSQTVSNDTQPDRTTDSYYKNLGSNIERLNALREGLFVMYIRYDGADKPKLWLTSDGDSILVYSRAIGNPDRHGFWLVHQQFMSKLSSEPLLTFVERLHRVSRDTFVGNSYIWEDAPSFNELSADDFSLPEDFDYDALAEGDFYEKLTYVRQHAAHFKGFSPKTSILNMELKEKYSAQKDTYDIRPEVASFNRVYFLEDGTVPDIGLNKMLHEMRRLPIEKKAEFRSGESSED